MMWRYLLLVKIERLRPSFQNHKGSFSITQLPRIRRKIRQPAAIPEKIMKAVERIHSELVNLRGKQIQPMKDI